MASVAVLSPSALAKLDEAEGLVRAGRHEEAIRVYESALGEQAPGALPRIMRGLGIAYYRKGDTAMSVVAFRRYLPWATDEERPKLEGFIRNASMGRQ